MTDTFHDTVSPEMRAMLGQLLIAMVKREGGHYVIPVSEVDDTSQDVLEMSVNMDAGTFTFTTSKKQ